MSYRSAQVHSRSVSKIGHGHCCADACQESDILHELVCTPASALSSSLKRTFSLYANVSACLNHRMVFNLLQTSSWHFLQDALQVGLGDLQCVLPWRIRLPGILVAELSCMGTCDGSMQASNGTARLSARETSFQTQF